MSDLEWMFILFMFLFYDSVLFGIGMAIISIAGCRGQNKSIWLRVSTPVKLFFLHAWSRVFGRYRLKNPKTIFRRGKNDTTSTDDN